MLQHYFKVSFRNLWKYKSQTLISVIGLGVGFTCFALATLWIRYETTFDTFHKNADRIYCVCNVSSTGIWRGGPYPLAGYLQKTFPEISNATAIAPRSNYNFEIDGVGQNADFLGIDSSFFSFFDVKILEGNRDFLIADNKKLAVTQEKAQQLFGTESPFGKILKFRGDDYTVCATVTGLPKRSNYPFDFLYPLSMDARWNYSHGEQPLIELIPNTDVELFKKKLSIDTVRRDYTMITGLTLTPLTTVRYEDQNIQREVKFQYIIIFAIAGSLLILCTLFNYLALFISRFKIRQREFALRTVFGASGRSLLAMLSVEFLVSLVIALVVGLLVIQPILEPFYTLSEIKMELSSIYIESLVYIAAVILVSVVTFLLFLAIFRRKTLNLTIRKSKKNTFRKISVIVQLIISIGFAFCSIVLLKQMYYLHNTDLGFAFKNRGAVVLSDVDADVLYDKIKQIPEITETVNGFEPLLPRGGRVTYRFSNWDDKPENSKKNLDLEVMDISEQYAAYYEFQLVEGEMLSDNDESKYVLINESAAQGFGWKTSVGKSFGENIVKGVVKNIYNFAPTISAKPIFYGHPQDESKRPSVMFKYTEGTWKSCKSKIENIIKEFPEARWKSITNAEEAYDSFLKSENTLLKILTFVSLVCIIICVFGFVSLISLTCEERRKEIAIRKINGATVKDILDLFFREYLVLLVAGSVIAFPLGYYVMRRWLEDYVLQTPISAWIYAVILLALIMSIILCVGWKVYKTSTENPASVVKS
jgi:ABC-type antimicrobial peptide transport system permease subunit